MNYGKQVCNPYQREMENRFNYGGSSKMPLPTVERHTRRHELISHKAFELWLEDGKPEGRDKEHWRIAEEIIFGKSDLDIDLVPLNER